jgi:hypothetical protein
MARDRDPDDLEPADGDDAEPGRAESFAGLIDGLLAGHPAPPALTPEDRDLLEAATLIRAAHSDAALAVERRDLLIERAFADALEIGPAVEAPASPPAGVVPLRRRLVRAAPWAAAAIAAAAAVVLAVGRPAPAARTVVVEKIELSAMHRSRPADPLIGRIAPADSGRASERIDIIFDDRLTGYRDLELRGLTARRRGPR